MELIRGRERDFGQEYLVRLSGQERERLESLVRASKSSCAIADEGGQLIPSAGLRLRCLFSSSRIALIFRPPQKNARCLRGVVDHTRSKSPGGDTSARAPTTGNDRSFRISLKNALLSRSRCVSAAPRSSGVYGTGRPSFRRRMLAGVSGGGRAMAKVSVLGVDLGKNVCSVVGLDASGAVLRQCGARVAFMA
jgi:hypothetical protein